MTNSDGGFQFDFQQPEKPVRPTVPPIPGQETAAYSTEPTAQATPALQFPQSVQSAQPTQPTQFVQPAQVAYASQPTQAVPTVQAAQPTQPIDPAMTQPFSPQFLAAVAAQAPQPAAATQPVVSETPIAAAPGQQQYVWDQTTQSFRRRTVTSGIFTTTFVGFAGGSYDRLMFDVFYLCSSSQFFGESIDFLPKSFAVSCILHCGIYGCSGKDRTSIFDLL